MTSSALEPEDLENVPLVRMEDVQPSRTRVIDIFPTETDCEEALETSATDEYDSEFNVNNDDVGSMVSIKSEEYGEADDSDAEMIVPELLDSPLDEIPIEIEKKEVKVNPPDRWPTLEILPGGVIKNTDKCDEDLNSIYPRETVADSSEMMYACAKCSQSFQDLMCLVKHVKWHDEEKKKQMRLDMSKLNAMSYTYIPARCGKQLLVFNKYTYKQSSESKNIFNCSRKSLHCKSILKLNKNGEIIYINEDHTHLPPKNRGRKANK